MPLTIEEAYLILEVNENSSISDIKKSFRKKAKQYHPDVNKEQDTEQLFIKITEAYNYLTSSPKTSYSASSTSDHYAKEEEIREQARKKAQEYARMKYEEFKKSAFYINDQAALVVLNHIQFFILTAFICLPIVGFFTFVVNLQWLGLIVNLIAVYFFHNYYKKIVDLDVSALRFAFKTLLKIKEIQYIGSLLINFFLFLNFPLNTQISFKNLILSYIVLNSSLLGIYFLKRIKKISIKSVLFIIAPFIFNLFFFINHTLSFTPQVETYHFKVKQSSMIQLQNSKYSNNSWFLFFVDGKDLIGKHYITYTFKDGIFGLRVLKDSELH